MKPFRCSFLREGVCGECDDEGVEELGGLISPPKVARTRQGRKGEGE
jgi:hypothetical protein